MRKLPALLAFLILGVSDFWPLGGTIRGGELAPQARPSDRLNASKTGPEQKTLSKAKEKLRDGLRRAGIDVSVSYTADLLGNPSGGRVLAFRYAGGLDVEFAFDLERILNLHGLKFRVSGDYRSGYNLAQDIGNVFFPAQIFALQRRFGVGTVRLEHLALEQFMFDNRFSLLVGRIGLGNDFLTSDLYGNYVQTAFNGTPIGVVINLPSLSVDPVTTWGWRGKYENEKWVFMGGIYYSDDTLGEDDKHGVDFSVRSDKGFTPIVQLGYKRNHGKSAAGLPGNYSVAYFYDSNRYEDLGDPTESRYGNYGFYFHADQMVYAEPGSGRGQGLTPFLAATVMPLTGINRIPYFLMGGLVYQGLFPGREQDTSSFGLAYGELSDRLAGTYEMAFELTHEFQVTSWLSLQPDVQYILRPGGTGNIPDAWVLGLELELTY